MFRTSNRSFTLTRHLLGVWLIVFVVDIEMGSAVQSPDQPNAPSAAQNDRLRERDALEKEAQGHEREGRMTEAIAAARKMLEIEQQVFGGEHDDSLRSLEMIARLQIQADDLAGAKQTRTALLEIRSMKFGPQHWQTQDAERAIRHLEFLQTISAADRKKLNEVTALAQSAVRLFQEGKSTEAAAAYAQIVETRKQILGERDPEYAISLANFAHLTDALGEAAKAEKLYLQAIQALRSTLGEKHPQLASTLINCAKLYQTRGELPKAERLLLQAVQIQRETEGDSNGAFAVTLSQLAGVYDSMAEYSKAEPLYLESLDIRKKHRGEESYEYLTGLNNLAVLYASAGRNQEAETLLRQALEINRKLYGDFHPVYASNLNNLAAILKTMGDLEAAEPLYMQALEIRKKLFGEKHADYAHSLNNLATLYVALGDSVRAEPLFLQALEIKKSTLGETHPDYAIGLNNLAEIRKVSGDFVLAEPLYHEALEIQKSTVGDRHPDYANTLSNLAMMYAMMGDTTLAESHFVQALDIRRATLGEHHPDYAISLNNLADLYSTNNQPEQAERLFRQALEINRAVFGENHPDYALSLGNLGSFYFSCEDYAKAEPLFRQSFEIRRATRGEQHPLYGVAISNLAMLYEIRGDFENAEPLYLQSHQIFRDVYGTRHPSYAENLSNLGRLKQSLGQHAEAKSMIQESVALKRSHIEATAAMQSERQQFLMDMAGKTSLDLFVSVAVSSSEYSSDVYEEVLASKGSVWRRQQRTRALQRNPELQPLFLELQSVAARRAQKTLSTPDVANADDWRNQLDELSLRQETIERTLANRSALLQAIQSPITANDIRRALPEKHVLVDFLEYDQLSKSAEASTRAMHLEKHLAAFVLRPDQTTVTLVPLGEVKTISSAIETWRTSYGQSAEAQHAGQQLKERVWSPLEPFLENTQTVLISPDGELGRFPLAALPGKAAGTFLLEERAIAVVPVPQAMISMLSNADLERKPVEGNLLVLGNVDYDAAPGNASPTPSRKKFGRHLAGVRGAEWRNFSPLPGTRGEVASIDRLYRGLFGDEGVTILEQGDASEAKFRAEAARHKFLHIATHGFFAPDSLRTALEQSVTRSVGGATSHGTEQYISVSPGLLSGLVLAGANREPAGQDDDGILTASEVESLDLQGVELSLLSACETGLGEVTKGEGLLGLQRSFQIAGARSVVASLWEVSDEATRSLMENFYDNLWNKELSTLESLREAQLSMLKEGRQRGLVRLDQPEEDDSAKRTPPFYWAAFVLSGDWR